MRRLAKKLGYVWAVIAGVPVVVFVHLIGDMVGASDIVIVSIQLPFLAIQTFGLFITLRYMREVFTI